MPQSLEEIMAGATGRQAQPQPGGTPAKPADHYSLQHMRPFQPGEYVDNGDGSYSTEILVTIPGQDGQWMNVPSLWMTPGGYVNLGDDEDSIAEAARLWEGRMGQFPRFPSVDAAVEAAKQRSATGGVFNGNLTLEEIMGR